MRSKLLLILIALISVFTDQTTFPGEKEQVITNSIGIKLVYISAGSFLMGSPFDQPNRQDDEQPHRVTLTKSYYLSTTEVTQKQWREVMEFDRGEFTGDDHPVEKVSWKDAVTFCEKLTQKESRTYRLPTEAEWEYACRAGGSGSSGITLDEMAWHANNSSEKTHPVGSKQPNAWGLYDMLGNVAEWCADIYHANYGKESATDPTGPAEGSYRVIRGGSWASFRPACRCAARSNAPPSYQFKQTGFRVLLHVD